MPTQINNLGIVFPDNTTQTTAASGGGGSILPLTIDTSGTGAASPLVFDGVTAATMSYNTLGAAALNGTNATGTWPIGISGNAATATAAGNVPYSGLTGTVPTWNQNTTGNAATASSVPYSGLTGTVPTWNQNTTGNAATADDLNTGAALATPASGNFSTGTFTWPTFNQNTTGSATASTNLKNGAVGDIVYQSAADTTAFLSIGTTGQVLSVSAGGLPTWTTPTGGGGAPGTPLNSVQYNSASAFAGSANMTFDGTTLTLAKDAVVNGVAVGQGLTSSVSSTALGTNALKLNTAVNNTAVGFNAGQAIISATDNTLVGFNAGRLISNSGNNTYIGAGVGQKATSSQQTGIGAYALQNCIAGSRNVAVGYNALNGVTATGSSTAVGTTALAVSVGSSNTAVGNNAGLLMTTGSNNTIIGCFTGVNSPLDIRALSNYIVLSDGANNANLYIDNNKNTTLAGTVRTAGYTVSTLPGAGVRVVGMRAYVTDALAPAFGVTVASGGTVTIPVFYNGSAWICG